MPKTPKIKKRTAHLTEVFLLAGVLILAAVLRTYRLNDLMMFDGVTGREFLTALTSFRLRSIPLTGSETGFPGIHEGPLWTLILVVSFFLFGTRPEPLALLTAILGTISV